MLQSKKFAIPIIASQLLILLLRFNTKPRVGEDFTHTPDWKVKTWERWEEYAENQFG
jgi:hypothetical protein